jgi:hypothetical protein
MKISKVGGTKEPSAARKKDKASGSDSGFADRLRETQGAGEVSPSGESGGVGAVESVFALQEVPDATDGRSRTILKDYGNDMLDRLDELRLGILNGVFSKDRLAELAQNMRQKRLDSDDPQLNALIKEIEMRAEIEIAKLTRNFS